MNKPLFPYKWYLKNGYPAQNIKKHNLKVYTTFSCGGGSSMGYKLAGYDVIGANDIDPQMAKVYKENHRPKFYDLCPISDLLTNELPEEYYNLDILDGSPPCSTFSMAGSREKAFKKDKVFREGQAKQVLSDLFFDWIKLVKKLKPKVAIAENVKGMLIGNAKAYTSTILKEIDKIGYDVQLFCLNSATMGIPQKRERVFFILRRKDLKLPKIKINFKEKPIIFLNFQENVLNGSKALSQKEIELWNCRIKSDLDFGSITERIEGKMTRFTTKLLKENKTPNTVTAGDNTILYSVPRKYTDFELNCIGSWPLDYNFLNIKPRYLIGMSVSPVMTAQIAHQVYEQIFNTGN
jgi:DNA (cytosine-5)-methyltransferase 1